MKPKPLIVVLDIWYAAVFVYFGGNRKECFNRFLLSQKAEPDYDVPCNSHVKASFLGDTELKDSAIWFRDKRPKPAVVAHEAFHAVFHTLEASGVKAEEAYAYTLEYLVQRIINGNKFR